MRPRALGRAGWTALTVAAGTTLATRVWFETLPARWSFSTLDLFQFFYTTAARAGMELSHGRLLLWNPDVGLGTSEVADIQIAMLYPPNLLFAVLPAAWAIEVVTAFHVTLAAAATFLLCRQTGLCIASAAVAAVALGAGQALHMLSGWTAILATFSWCPVACLAARALGDAPGPRRGLALGAVLGLQVLAGYPQLHLYTVACLPLFAFGPRPWRRGTVRVAGWIIAAEVLALALGAVALAPAMAAVGASIRSRAALEPWFYEILPVRLASYRAGLAAPDLDARAPLYAGVLVPLLALAGLVARGAAPRLRVPAIVLTAVAIVFSLGRATPIFPLLWRLPIAHWLTGPYKWTYFAAFGVALLAAVGTESLAGAHADGTAIGWGRRGLWMALGAALLAVVPFSASARLLGALTLVGLGVGLTRRRPALVAAALPVGAFVAILAGYDARTLRPKDDMGYFTRYAPAYHYLAARQAEGRTFLLMPPLAIAIRQGEIEGVAQVNTYESFFGARLFAYLGAVTKGAQDPAQHPRMTALLRAVGARFIMTPHDAHGWLAGFGLERVLTSPAADVWRDAAVLPRAYVARDVVVVSSAGALARIGDPDIAAAHAAVLESEEDVPPAVAARDGEATVTLEEPTSVRIAVRSAAPALLVLLDAWSPDWRATVDGTPVAVRHANVLARAVAVPSGAHEVVFRFVPVAFYAGAAVSLVALSGSVLAALFLVRRGRVRAGRRRLATA